MIDEDIKELLTSLNMTHFVEEIEKASQKTAQIEPPIDPPLPPHNPVHFAPMAPTQIDVQKLVLQDEIGFEDQELKEAKKLQARIKQVNEHLVPQKSSKMRLIGLLGLFLVVGTTSYVYFHSLPQENKSEEVVVQHEAPQVEKLSGEAQNGGEALKVENTPKLENLSKLLDERKLALVGVTKEIEALIAAHSEKKVESFASKLTHLASKCQAIDEDYSVKIAQEIKLQKEKNSPEVTELLTTLNW